MQEFPHRYGVVASASPEGDIALDADRLPTLHSAAPTEFDGPGDRWSPETLLVAAVADCFVLTFRGIARVSKLPWISLTCDVTGTLDRVERITQFTGFLVRVRLQVPAGTNQEQAQRVLTKTEQTCLVVNSLKAGSHLETEVNIMPA